MCIRSKWWSFCFFLAPFKLFSCDFFEPAFSLFWFFSGGSRFHFRLCFQSTCEKFSYFRNCFFWITGIFFNNITWLIWSLLSFRFQLVIFWYLYHYKLTTWVCRSFPEATADVPAGPLWDWGWCTCDFCCAGETMTWPSCCWKSSVTTSLTRPQSPQLLPTFASVK